MIILGKYKEFAPGMGYPSIKNDISDTEYDGKTTILNYLRSGKVYVATASSIVDVLTKERTEIKKTLMTDGNYSWCNSIIYYVEKYNLRLPIEFEKYVLNKLVKPS